MRKIIVKNFWLKALALLLAVAAWFYVVGELNKGTAYEKALFEWFLPYRVEAKEVPIKVALIGKPFRGYRILNEQISVRPSSCVVMGPKRIVANIEYVTTEDIDIAEFTKSVARQVKIRPMGPGIVLQKNFFVMIIIPVEKIEQETQSEGK